MDRSEALPMDDVTLQLFVKAPEPGHAKTRLIPVLGAAGAARLARELALHALRAAIASRIQRIELWCTPDCTHPFFTRCVEEFGIIAQTQRGRDLGERMGFALASALRGRPRALLVGTDCPTLDPADFRAAALALRDGCDAVLSPARDGGYVLLGLSRMEPGLFEGVDWGSGRVLAQTRCRLREAGCRWRELREHQDVDRPEDLGWLFRDYPHWSHFPQAEPMLMGG